MVVRCTVAVLLAGAIGYLDVVVELADNRRTAEDAALDRNEPEAVAVHMTVGEQEVAARTEAVAGSPEVVADIDLAGQGEDMLVGQVDPDRDTAGLVELQVVLAEGSRMVAVDAAQEGAGSNPG